MEHQQTHKLSPDCAAPILEVRKIELFLTGINCAALVLQVKIIQSDDEKFNTFDNVTAYLGREALRHKMTGRQS